MVGIITNIYLQLMQSLVQNTTMYIKKWSYTQSYACDEGWTFIISLFNRMGSGYIFDRTEIDPEDAKEKLIRYWDGYEFIKEPDI